MLLSPIIRPSVFVPVGIAPNHQNQINPKRA